MHKAQITFALFLLFSVTAYAQTMIQGVVTDSLQKPIPYANVLAKPKDSLQQIKFSITDEQGGYKIELEATPYTITANSMGYAPYSFEINTNKKELTYNIVLKEQAEQLSEVIVEIPILVKKDTIVYNVDQLTTGKERKLKDVLKKLPGVEVSRDGEVTVQGKKVTTVLVENKKFFGGDSKLAVDNIPANALDQIEIIDNYNEIALLKGLVESNEMAMNIKLKEDKKNFAFGDITAGIGNQDFYNFHGNLFYYSPKTTVNLISNANNIAAEVFTYKQYFDFQSNLNQTFTQGNTDFEMPNDDFLQFIESNDVVKSDRKFGAINFTKEVNTKLNISGYGIFSRTKEETLSQSINQYNTFTEQKDVGSATDNIFAIGSMDVSYLPNLTDAWNFKTKFKKTNNQYYNTISSQVDTAHANFLTQEKAKGSYFNQTIEWHRKASRTHTYSVGINYTFEEGNPNKLWETTDKFLQGIIPIVQDSIYRINQNKRLKSNKLEAIFKHYWVINKNNHMYSTVGNTYYGQSFFTNDSQRLTDGTTNDFSGSNFGNDLDFNLNDLFLGLNYKFRTGIFTFNQGAFLHYYHWNLNQEGKLEKDHLVVLPNLSIEAELDRLTKLNLSYEKSTSFSKASKFANNYYLQSYNTVYRGNEDLQNEIFHNISFRYSKYSGYKGIRLYLTAKYIKKTEGVVENIDYSGVNQQRSPIFLDDPESRWTVLGSIKKKIHDINFGLLLSYNNSTYLQQLNTVNQTNKNNTFSYNVSAKTLFDNFPIIEVGYKQNTGNYTLSSEEAEFITSEPYLNVDYDFLKGFIFSFDYSSYTYKNKSLNQKNSYELANTSLFYKMDSSAWSFEIEAQNLFGVQFKNQHSFNSYIISDTKTFILPRVFMFSITYNL